MANLNINQFQQGPVRGQLDQQISKSGIITVQVSVNQATSLNPGDRVKLDTANTTGNVPQIVSAAASDTNGIGVIVFSVDKGAFAAGDYCGIALHGGPVMWLKAASTIQCGVAVEDAGSGQIQTKSANKQLGVALDPGVTGNLMRVILTNPTLN